MLRVTTSAAAGDGATGNETNLDRNRDVDCVRALLLPVPDYDFLDLLRNRDQRPRIKRQRPKAKDLLFYTAPPAIVP